VQITKGAVATSNPTESILLNVILYTTIIMPYIFTANKVILTCYCGIYTVKMNMLYLIKKIVATDYKQYYWLNLTN